MSFYEYRCHRHGTFDVVTSMGSASPQSTCPECGMQAPRIFTAPMTSAVPPSIAKAIGDTERSRYEPDVVSSLPRRRASQRTPMAPANPALQRLPRP